MFRTVLIALAILTAAIRLASGLASVDTQTNGAEERELTGTRKAFELYVNRGCTTCGMSAFNQLAGRAVY